MKRYFICLIFTLIFLCEPAIAKQFETYDYDNVSSIQQKINSIGFRLLNANLYEKRITFFLENAETPKVKLNARQKRVVITKGVMPYLDNDDELSAVLSMGIAHIMDCHDGFFKRFSMSFSPRKYETKSDKKAVDIMVKAGYNPIGLINILTKTDKENSWFEYNVYHHNGSERVVCIYQHIYEKYPVYLAKNEYLAEYPYQNFLTTTQTDRKRLQLLFKDKFKHSKIKDEI